MFVDASLPARSAARHAHSTSVADPRAELQFLFKAYDAAMLDFDADAVASFYDLPCLLSTPEGNGSFTARGELRAVLARGFAAYRQRGLVSASMTSLSLKALSADFAQGEVVWSFANQRGNEIASFACAYTLRSADRRWRIVHALALDAATDLAARKAVLRLSPRD